MLESNWSSVIGGLPSAGDVFPVFLFVGGLVRDPSVFIDESGSDGLKDKYYLVTLVLHA